MTIITTSDEQQAFNQQQCPDCDKQRWQHVNAILCSETEPTLSELMTEVQSLREDVAFIRSFIEQLQSAIQANPLARNMFGG